MKEVYLARDKDSTLCMYNHYPKIEDGLFANDLEGRYNDFVYIESSFFPEVTFENSPVKIEIKICDTEK